MIVEALALALCGFAGGVVFALYGPFANDPHELLRLNDKAWEAGNKRRAEQHEQRIADMKARHDDQLVDMAEQHAAELSALRARVLAAMGEKATEAE